MNLPTKPNKYELEGGAEGKRALYENREVYRTVPPGAAEIVEHDRRKVATFTNKATVTQIERIAWLDYDVHNDPDPEQRRAALTLLAGLFRGEPSPTEGKLKWHAAA